VIQYWENGAPERGLATPLKEWANIYSSSDYRSEGTKLSNIKHVYNEWAVEYEKDDTAFDHAYAGLRGQYTKLRKAILEACKLRNTAKSRCR
jgi:hypothetical protein